MHLHAVGSGRGQFNARECVLFIGTQCSTLYTAVDTPEPRDMHDVSVFACKYVYLP
jgi:hypothetical protein